MPSTACSATYSALVLQMVTIAPFTGSLQSKLAGDVARSVKMSLLHFSKHGASARSMIAEFAGADIVRSALLKGAATQCPDVGSCNGTCAPPLCTIHRACTPSCWKTRSAHTQAMHHMASTTSPWALSLRLQNPACAHQRRRSRPERAIALHRRTCCTCTASVRAHTAHNAGQDAAIGV